MGAGGVKMPSVDYIPIAILTTHVRTWNKTISYSPSPEKTDNSASVKLICVSYILSSNTCIHIEPLGQTLQNECK